MAHDFVPLLKPSDLCLATALPASPPCSPEPEFRPVLACSFPCSAAAPEVGPLGPVPPPQSSPPTITLKREGDRVTQVQIRCSCGELIELNCVYGL